MAITCAFGIYLYDFCTHRHFYFFNSIENKRTQSTIKTIKIYYVFEVNIFASKVVLRTFVIFLERISVCTKSIVADIEKISNCLVFIFENKSTLF